MIVGGRNKYMINGTAATNQKVADLFKSVSLNINNPHFLIMQGRITKVLNMKPPEVSCTNGRALLVCVSRCLCAEMFASEQFHSQSRIFIIVHHILH